MGWICFNCSTSNEDSDSTCFLCGQSKEDSKRKAKEYEDSKKREKPIIKEKPVIKEEPKKEEYVSVDSYDDSYHHKSSSSKLLKILNGFVATIFIILILMFYDNWNVLQYIIAIESGTIITYTIIKLSIWLEDEYKIYYACNGTKVGFAILGFLNIILLIIIGLPYEIIAFIIGGISIIGSLVSAILAWKEYESVWLSVLTIITNIIAILVIIFA